MSNYDEFLTNAVPFSAAKSPYGTQPLNRTIFDNITVNSSEAQSIKIDPRRGQKAIKQNTADSAPF